MSCQRCVDWVTEALRGVEGVSDATVDLSRHVATVEGVAGAAALVRCVSDTGYTARVIRSKTTTARGSTPTRVLDLEAPDDDEDSPLVNSTGVASDGIRSPDRGERSVTLRVSGMSCASCVAKVEEAAMTVPGVASATVNLLAETATVRLARDARLDAPPADPDDVAAAVASYGYAAEVIDTSGLAFRVGGMVCASCPPRIEMAIGRVKGVARVEANYLLGKVVVQYNAAVVGARMIKAAIEVLMEEPQHHARLWENTNYFRKELQSMGFDTGDSVTPIIPVMCGESSTAKAMTHALGNEGVMAGAIVFPMVARDKARIRTQMSAGLTRQDLDDVLAVFERVGPQVGVI